MPIFPEPKINFKKNYISYPKKTQVSITFTNEARLDWFLNSNKKSKISLRLNENAKLFLRFFYPTNTINKCLFINILRFQYQYMFIWVVPVTRLANSLILNSFKWIKFDLFSWINQVRAKVMIYLIKWANLTHKIKKRASSCNNYIRISVKLNNAAHTIC